MSGFMANIRHLTPTPIRQCGLDHQNYFCLSGICIRELREGGGGKQERRVFIKDVGITEEAIFKAALRSGPGLCLKRVRKTTLRRRWCWCWWGQRVVCGGVGC